MPHLHLETNYKILRYRQKKPVKVDYPSFNERPNANFFFNYKNQRQVIASVVMNLRIHEQDDKLLDRWATLSIYTVWSKSLCAPDFCIVIIRCTETFWSPYISMLPDGVKHRLNQSLLAYFPNMKTLKFWDHYAACARVPSTPCRTFTLAVSFLNATWCENTPLDDHAKPYFLIPYNQKSQHGGCAKLCGGYDTNDNCRSRNEA